MDGDHEHDDSSGAESKPEPQREPTQAANADAPAEPDPADTLSPAVRRLVRQYDLDISGVQGTGPAGKIRVADVIGLLGSRAEPSARASEAPGVTDDMVGAVADDGSIVGVALSDSAPREDEPPVEGDAGAAAAPAASESAGTGTTAGAATTTVFECDLSRVLSHRKRGRRNDIELLLTSYFVAACVDALSVVPEIASVDGREDPQSLGVLIATADGGLRRTFVAAAEQELAQRLHAIDRQLRASGDDDLRAAHLLIHHYGPSGSLLATPTELGAGHAASVGIGRVRREIVVKTVDGEEAPRVAALCYVTLTFLPERVALERANRFVATLVRTLEQWPAEPTNA